MNDTKAAIAVVHLQFMMTNSTSSVMGTDKRPPGSAATGRPLDIEPPQEINAHASPGQRGLADRRLGEV
jgi:hypothetical protein